MVNSCTPTQNWRIKKALSFFTLFLCAILIKAEVPKEFVLSENLAKSDTDIAEGTTVLAFSPTGLNQLNNSSATCSESSDGSLTIGIDAGKAPYTFQWSNGVTTNSGQAITGYTLLGHYNKHSYYRSVSQASNYNDAQAEAVSHFGNLVSINSAEENVWLMANGVVAGDNLGGSDAAQEGVWQWASGEPFDYINWSPGEPNNGGGNQSYFQIYADGKWDDVNWPTSASARHIIEVTAVSQIGNLTPGMYTCTVTDAEGTQFTDSFNIGPDPIEISFLMTETSTCDETGDGELEAQVSGGTAPYSYVWSSGETSATIANKAIGHYTVFVEDANNCDVVEATGTVLSDDTTTPVVLVKAASIYLDNAGLATITVEDIDDGSYDDCAIESMYVASPDYDCSVPINPLGLSATLVVVDFSGNEASADANINLIDTIKPLAIARDIEVLLDSVGFATINVIDVDNGSSDNCFVAARDINITEFSCENLGEQEVIITVRDASANESEAISTVTIVDEMAPVMPELITMDVYLDEDGMAIFSTAPLLAEASDNCAVSHIMDIEMEQDPNGFTLSCEQVGMAERPLLVIDESGNSTPFLAQVNVIDTIKPVFTLDLIQLEIDEEGNASITQEMIMPYANDNCAIAEVVIQVADFNCSQLGAMQYTEILVYDVHGNATQTTLEVQLMDAIAPEVQVEDLTVELNLEGVATLTVGMLEITTADNCGVSNFSLSQENFTCNDLGDRAMNITVADLSGNSGVAAFTVTIADSEAPVITAPESIMLCEGMPVNYDELAATDNCSVQLNLISGPQAGETPQPGEFIVEFEAVDPSGNMTSTFIPLVVSTYPVVNLGDDMEVEQGSIVTLVAGTDADNSYIWSNGSSSPMYQFVATEDVLISVEVASPEGCASTDEIEISVSNPLGIAEDATRNSVRFFPNPTNGEMSITLSLAHVAANVQIQIYDITGKSVASQLLPTAKDGDVISLNLAGFTKGIYLVNIQSDAINLTERIIKQ